MDVFSFFFFSFFSFGGNSVDWSGLCDWSFDVAAFGILQFWASKGVRVYSSVFVSTWFESLGFAFPCARP
jgi:hypothetical protein